MMPACSAVWRWWRKTVDYPRGMTVLRKSIFYILLNLVTVSTLYAGPANPDPVDISLPDGSVITAKLHGDEFQNWTELLETGHTIILNNSSGFWEYAEQNTDGTLRKSGVKVQPKGINAPAHIAKGLRPQRNKDAALQMDLMLQDIYQQRLSSSGEAVSPEDSSAAVGDWIPTPVSGPRKMLLILVGFANRAFVTTPVSWSTAVFDLAVKSLAKYYKDNSFNTLNISPVTHSQPGNPAGVVSVALTTNHPNLGGSYTFASDQAWGNEALKELVDNNYVDFNALDTNGNGILEPSEVVIYFIAAGYETSAGSGLTPSVWAHAWRTSGTGLTAGTKNVQRWSQNGEYYNATIQMPIGVIAHELGHQMGGLPDLYDTSSPTVNSALGEFSLMAGGSWGGDYVGGVYETGGTTPTALDAWSREFLGWTAPVTPATGSAISLPHALSASNAAIKLVLPTINSSEYFLAENRYPIGWDLGLKRRLGASWAGGMLLTHIDITAGTLGSNDINKYTTTIVTPGHQGVVPVQARTTLCNMLVGTACRGHATTLFYQANNNSWGGATTPNSNYYSGFATYFSLTSISSPGSTMTANLMMQTAPFATTDPASAISSAGALLNGTVNDNFSSTTVNFDYGLTTDYGNSASGGTISAGTGNTVISATISSLACNTTYHFRVKGTNSIGTTIGSDKMFTTSACLPGAPSITSVSAGNSRAIVYLSPPASNGGSQITSYTVTSSDGFSASGDSVPIVVTGLANGTPYTFTAKATNIAGTGPASTSSAVVIPGIAIIDDMYEIGYQSLQLAYADDTDEEEIMLLANTSVGGLTVNSENTKGEVKIIGGYNDTFLMGGGMPSILDSVTLSAGKTNFQNVIIKAPVPNF